MKKTILILMTGILLISIVSAIQLTPKSKELYNGFCGITNKDKIISYNKNSECVCPNGLMKIQIFVKPICEPLTPCNPYHFPIYTCQTEKLCKIR